MKDEYTLVFDDTTIDYWITSDLHFAHKNILQFDNRPFVDIKHMEKTLINNWNKVVKENDVIFYIGDLSFGSPGYTRSILDRLNGIKYFIKGNHDKKDNIKLFKEYGTLLLPIHKIEINKQRYILSHYPIESWEGMNTSQKTIHIHGHCHTEISRYVKNRHNVATNLRGYMPVDFPTYVK